ncbi:MAG TPA: hypothetical protein VN778_05320, partial [Verrucomicrobiae bacterium]|nr:hypothetical protein [Verrucomicrobiae bacterium]
MPTPKNDKDPKVMDVERPGSSTPSASAKPIIVTNRPILRRDPMMATPDGLDKPVTTTLPGPVSRIAKTVRVVQPTASTPDKTEKPTTSAAKAGAVAPPKLEDLIAAKTADANERVSADKKEATPAPAAGVTPSDADQP